MKALLVFIDGLGLRPPAEDNPVNPRVCPTLCRLIDEQSVAIDPRMDVPGLPQSATGQVALYTGVNSALRMGRHKEGFPGPTLNAIIEESNLFKTLDARGLRCCFADGYYADTIDDLRCRRFKSVTTVMALTTPKVIRLAPELLSNQAVLHDLTRESIRTKGFPGPFITPEKAAEHLLLMSLSNDFTLFEYFLSDLAGHSQSYEQASKVLGEIDAFLSALLPPLLEKQMLFLLTSDHGNIEDLSTRGHTANDIPFIAIGPGSETLLANVKRITDITPQLLLVMSRNAE